MGAQGVCAVLLLCPGLVGLGVVDDIHTAAGQVFHAVPGYDVADQRVQQLSWRRQLRFRQGKGYIVFRRRRGHFLPPGPQGFRRGCGRFPDPCPDGASGLTNTLPGRLSCLPQRLRPPAHRRDNFFIQRRFCYPAGHQLRAQNAEDRQRRKGQNHSFFMLPFSHLSLLPVRFL